MISSFLIRLCLEFAWLHLGFAYIAHLGFSLLHIFHIWDSHISQNLGIAFIACLLTLIQSLVVLMVVTVMMMVLLEVMKYNLYNLGWDAAAGIVNNPLQFNLGD